MGLKCHLASFNWYDKFGRFRASYPVSDLLRLLEKDFTSQNVGCADAGLVSTLDGTHRTRFDAQ